LRKHGNNGAVPPSSEIMPKHDENLECIGEKKWQIAGVSVHCIDATVVEKARQ
jgi:hypothetical protein